MGLRAYVHGDDFVVVGMPIELARWRKSMEEKYELKVETLGPGKEDKKEVRVLNRILRWTKEGIEYEADPRHVEIMLKQLNIQDCKFVATPGTKEEGQIKEGDKNDNVVSDSLSSERTSAYRALVARANYLSPDRPDIAFSVKELARSMSSPCGSDWLKLKRLARYLKGKPRIVMKFRWQKPIDKLGIFTDADWAGDKQSRKSTTGGCIMAGKHLLKSWSKTQTLVALSSGKFELFATLKQHRKGWGSRPLPRMSE